MTRTQRILRPTISGVLTAVALAFGAFTLTAPLARDQGLYYYVGREWAVRGAIPYRDVLDHKTPGIYVMHALAVWLFGEHIWAFRLLEMAVVAALGIVAAWLTVPRGGRVPSGARALGALVAFVVYYGCFDYWNSGQSEIWYATSGLTAMACAVKVKEPRRAAVLAGVLAGVAIIFKPPSAAFCLAAYVMVAGRAVRERARGTRWPVAALRASAWFGAGAALPVGLVLAYFGAHHALADMVDIVVGANGYYVAHEGNERRALVIATKSLDVVRLHNPLAGAALLGFCAMSIESLSKRDAAGIGRASFAATAVLAGWLAVVMQGKFYFLHWGAVVPPFTLICVLLLERLRVWIGGRWPQLAVLAPALPACMLLGLYFLSGAPAATWHRATAASLAHARGKLSREDYASRFSEPPIGFSALDSELVGRWLAEHSTPADLVTVRGFEPQIYAIAQRRHAGRFFWTTFLTSPVRAYKREAWLAEDRAALLAAPPRYVVSLTWVEVGPDSTAFFLAMGYRPVHEVRGLTVLERTVR